MKAMAVKERRKSDPCKQAQKPFNAGHRLGTGYEIKL